MSGVVRRANTERSNSTDAATDRSGTGATAPTESREFPVRADPPMENFIGEQNISRFVEQFIIAHDPRTRQTLQKLLIEEEKKFGFNSGQLEKIQRRISACKERIDQHERLIHKARANGHDTSAAERVLDNLIELQEFFWCYHQVVLEAINRNRL
jgi:hypothetical protein